MSRYRKMSKKARSRRREEIERQVNACVDRRIDQIVRVGEATTIRGKIIEILEKMARPPSFVVGVDPGYPDAEPVLYGNGQIIKMPAEESRLMRWCRIIKSLGRAICR